MHTAWRMAYRVSYRIARLVYFLLDDHVRPLRRHEPATPHCAPPYIGMNSVLIGPCTLSTSPHTATDALPFKSGKAEWVTTMHEARSVHAEGCALREHPREMRQLPVTDSATPRPNCMASLFAIGQSVSSWQQESGRRHGQHPSPWYCVVLHCMWACGVGGATGHGIGDAEFIDVA